MYNINMEYIKKAESFIESKIEYPLTNPYIMAVLKVTLILYAAQLAPSPPEYIKNLFKNVYVKLLAIFLIVYLAEKDIQLAILIAVIYVFSMNLLSGRGILESFSVYSDEYKKSGSMKLIEPQTMLYPGCEGVTMDDLYKLFKGDNEKMQTSVHHSFRELMRQLESKDEKETLIRIAYAAGLPYNLSFDKPETAPYIATLLVNYGYVINDKCQAPK
jgi:hypothetical protein